MGIFNLHFFYELSFLFSSKELVKCHFCLQDPSKDPQLSFGDFAAAAELDPDNADIYHHRGQVERINNFWFDLHEKSHWSHLK